MKTLIGAALLGISTSIFASELAVMNKKVTCGETKFILNLIAEEFQEKVVFSGPSPEEKSVYLVLMNSKTGTWTVLQGNEKVTCVIGVGEGGKVNIGPVIGT